MHQCARCKVELAGWPEFERASYAVICPRDCPIAWCKLIGASLDSWWRDKYAARGYAELALGHSQAKAFLGWTAPPTTTTEPEWLPEALKHIAAARPHRVSYIRLEQMIELGYLTATGASLTEKGQEKCSVC